MHKSKLPEVWLRGPLPSMPPLLQPVAHALLQAREEVKDMLVNFPEGKVWDRVAGLASVGFHLQHLTGVLNRLFTYAANENLNEAQLEYLAMEGKGNGKTVAELVEAFNKQVDKAIHQLSQTDEQTLTETRGVGRAQIPSTVIGLLVHAAEHTMRHVGQLLVTVRVTIPRNLPDGEE
jgi:uncharacterized damage-inducible protein DinB